jgi:hypothetical protein
MLSVEILLRPRYSLSFFTTTLLIALSTQSSLAFSINSLENWDTEARYTLADQRQGITTTGSLRSLARGGTTTFLRTLARDFPDWNFNVASSDLTGSFNVSIYDPVGINGRVVNGNVGDAIVGAQLNLNYQPGTGDPTAQGNSLHWIQRVFSNHRPPNLNDHGMFEDRIDIGSGVKNPFYDTRTDEEIRNNIPPLAEGTFSDGPRREGSRNHSWLAELYLVEETAPRYVTIYNGIGWDWGNTVEPVPEQDVPEPLTIFGAAAALGYGAILKRKYSKNTES